MILEIYNTPFLEACPMWIPFSRFSYHRDLAALGRSHGIGWENNEQAKLTIEPSTKTKHDKSAGTRIEIQLN